MTKFALSSSFAIGLIFLSTAACSSGNVNGDSETERDGTSTESELNPRDPQLAGCERVVGRVTGEVAYRCPEGLEQTRAAAACTPFESCNPGCNNFVCVFTKYNYGGDKWFFGRTGAGSCRQFTNDYGISAWSAYNDVGAPQRLWVPLDCAQGGGNYGIYSGYGSNFDEPTHSIGYYP